MPVYEVLAVETPTKKDAEDNGAMERIVFGPKLIVAKNDQAAMIAAVVGEDALKGVDQSRLFVSVRPF